MQYLYGSDTNLPNRLIKLQFSGRYLPNIERANQFDLDFE